MFNYKLNLKNNRSLASGLPQMANTLNGWEVPLTLTKITQKIENGDRVTTEEKINFQGVVQPLKPEDLQFKPEGLRSFVWLQIHCKSGQLNLKTQDKIVFNNIRYKVMDIKDYSLYSYIEYHVVEDYQ